MMKAALTLFALFVASSSPANAQADLNMICKSANYGIQLVFNNGELAAHYTINGRTIGGADVSATLSFASPHISVYVIDVDGQPGFFELLIDDKEKLTGKIYRGTTSQTATCTFGS